MGNQMHGQRDLLDWQDECKKEGIEREEKGARRIVEARRKQLLDGGEWREKRKERKGRLDDGNGVSSYSRGLALQVHREHGRAGGPTRIRGPEAPAESCAPLAKAIPSSHCTA